MTQIESNRSHIEAVRAAPDGGGLKQRRARGPESAGGGGLQWGAASADRDRRLAGARPRPGTDSVPLRRAAMGTSH